MLYFSSSLQSEITAAVFNRTLLTSQNWVDILNETRGDSKALLEFVMWDNKRPIKPCVAA